jgi:hypothetical protein
MPNGFRNINNGFKIKLIFSTRLPSAIEAFVNIGFQTNTIYIYIYNCWTLINFDLQ